MLPPLATPEQLAVRVGKTDFAVGAEADRAFALLEDASSLVRFEVGLDWVDPDTGALLTTVPDVAVTITLSAATRAWFNPAQVQSEQLGAAMVRFGDVWLTSAEAERLAGLNTSASDLTSVSLTPGFGFERPVGLGWAPADYGEGQWPYADWAPIGY